MSLMGIWVGTPNYTGPIGSGTSPGLMYSSYWGQCQIADSVCLLPPARSVWGVRHTIWPASGPGWGQCAEAEVAEGSRAS